jgi:hypothetical protein
MRIINIHVQKDLNPRHAFYLQSTHMNIACPALQLQNILPLIHVHVLEADRAGVSLGIHAGLI